LGVEVHEVEDYSGGEVAGCVADFHALVDVDEFYECEIGFIDGFVVWDFGVDSGDIIFDCIIWVPPNVLGLLTSRRKKRKERGVCTSGDEILTLRTFCSIIS
jgi:hypothetical protein